jgi:hypothetical protein
MSAFFLYLFGPEAEVYLGDDYINRWPRKSLQNKQVKKLPAAEQEGECTTSRSHMDSATAQKFLGQLQARPSFSRLHTVPLYLASSMHDAHAETRWWDDYLVQHVDEF